MAAPRLGTIAVRVTGLPYMRRLIVAAEELERLQRRYQTAASPHSRRLAREAIVAAVPKLVDALRSGERH